MCGIELLDNSSSNITIAPFGKTIALPQQTNTFSAGRDSGFITGITVIFGLITTPSNFA